MNDEEQFQVTFSAEIGALAEALAAAQGEFEDAKKDATNPHFKAKFASLSSVRAAVQPVLSKHGLAATFPFEPHGPDGVCIVTLLLHKSGQWIRGRLYLPVSKKDAQGFGSAISYGRRYSLQGITGIATDDDDDGNEASKPTPAKTEAKPVDVKGPPATASVDVDALAKALEEANDTTALAKASMSVGNAKSKLTPPQLERLRGLLASRTRQLAEADEKGKAA